MSLTIQFMQYFLLQSKQEEHGCYIRSICFLVSFCARCIVHIHDPLLLLFFTCLYISRGAGGPLWAHALPWMCHLIAAVLPVMCLLYPWSSHNHICGFSCRTRAITNYLSNCLVHRYPDNYAEKEREIKVGALDHPTAVCCPQ